jgi:TRAP-type uncharacterized transport system substrate-binding protein
MNMNNLPLIAVVLVFTVFPVQAQQKSVRLSIATGGTGGVYYPLGGGLANVLSKNLLAVEATAEVTSASVDNIKLIGARKADVPSAWRIRRVTASTAPASSRRGSPSVRSQCSTRTRASG